MDKIIEYIRRELKAHGKKEIRESALRFFKESTKHYGWKNAGVNKLAAETFREIKAKNKEEIFRLCTELWKSGYMEEALIACNWSYRCRKNYTEKDFDTFNKWVGKYVSNWATCDTLCCRGLGEFIIKYPEFIPQLRKWGKSKNRWYRRAAAVALNLAARRGMFLKESLEISLILLEDEDDLVQKGYGWLLKTQSETHQKEVHSFVMKHKKKMPRTALRYAMEKMPATLKKEAMER